MTEEDNNESENTKYKDGVNRNARLIIRNISFKATEESLREHFAKYGTVEEVKLLKKADGKLVGCAFVHFTHVPMANKAIAATNKKPFLGRPIYVSWAVPKHQYNGEQNGSPTKKRQTSGSSDDVKVEVKDEDTADNQKPSEDKNKMRVNRNARLIIRNVSFKATEESLKEHFEPYGNILEVKLLKKPDGKLVGCAFVHFKNVPMAKKALLNTNMKPFLGRPISVDWAVPKDKYMQHVVNKQLEMQDDVKKEESDSDDELMDTSTEVKQEVKSESDSSDENDGEESEADEEEKESDDDEDDEDDENDEDDDDEDDEDGEVDEDQDDDDDDEKKDIKPTFQRTKLNDAEDGCTVFITNIPFMVADDQLKTFAENTGPVKYALICVDKLTEHSKGSGFVKFANKEDAEKFLSLPPEQLRLEGQVLGVKPALKKENLQQGNKKQPKDNRNLYLVKEGVVAAGTRAAVGVSQSDMAKRLALERSKTQMLKNLNRFVSRYRLVVSNLTPNITDQALRRLVLKASPARSVVTEARVMRDLRAPVGRDGRHPSKGYGFVMFTRHEDALACLRKLNNNPDIFDTHNRPIVSFSIEDRTALNARKKRLEKSIANNPLAKKDDQDNTKKGRRNRKRKMTSAPDESYMKKRRVENGEKGAESDYTGLTAKEGSQHKIRNIHKLRAQADMHKQNVKIEKKKNKKAHKIKMARERIKQPKQKINKNKTGKRNKKRNSSFEIR
ncbi:RNA-binding protein 28-like [Danaus plexippus]|uniref:RNA-binding protein 28-like n=1 Tax=Danaus plexippus TaxID=13037 RepID=UPI002AB16C70|nr:RNA-binding protein 28-like [Danaus plexippus]